MFRGHLKVLLEFLVIEQIVHVLPWKLGLTALLGRLPQLDQDILGVAHHRFRDARICHPVEPLVSQLPLVLGPEILIMRDESVLPVGKQIEQVFL